MTVPVPATLNLTLMSSKLQNYVRTHRRRAGLSQKEMAFLLGCTSEAKVSRYERFVRQPTLETVLAYEAIFGAPARELFAGVYERARAEIQNRARALSENLDGENTDASTARKREFLNRVASYKPF